MIRRLVIALAIAVMPFAASAQVANPIIKPPLGRAGVAIADQLDDVTINFFASANNTGSEYVYGWGTGITRLGGVSSPAPTATAYGQYQVQRQTTAGVANAVGGSVTTVMTAAGLGSRATGFRFEALIRTDAYGSGYDFFCGLFRANQAMTSTTAIVPSTFLDAVGLQFDSGSNGNYQICSNDAAGSATCVDTGVARTTLGVFHLTLEADPDGSIDYVLFRRDTDAIVTEGTLASDLPTSTTGFRVLCCVEKGAAAAVFLDLITYSLVFPY